MNSRDRYSPPWRERQKDGTLGPEYGPKSASAYQRQCAEFKDWSFRDGKHKRPEAEMLHAFMRGPDGELREGMPEGESGVYLLIVEDGMSFKAAARLCDLSRSTIKVYWRRLVARAKGAQSE